jgi:hypothetical protein
MLFTLSTPFLYDPSKGNLLFDFQISGYSGTGTGQFDVEGFQNLNPPGGSVASVFTITGSPTGQLNYSSSITQFGYTLVPEPSYGALMLGGLGAMVAMRRRRNRG